MGKSIKILSVLISFNITYCFGQDGNFFLKHYSNVHENADPLTFSIRESNEGILYFANPKGLLSYDGSQWNLLSTDNAPLVIEPDKERIYAGFKNQLGYFYKKENGELLFKEIQTEQKKFNEIRSIHFSGPDIFFCSSKNIFRFSKWSDKVIQTLTSKSEFSGEFIFKNELYVNLDSSGLYKIINNKFIPFEKGNTFSKTEILFALPINESEILIGTDADELYTFNGKEIQKFYFEGDYYLKENFLSDAIQVSDREIVLSTLSGGCLVLNINSKKISHFINYQTGLPDNEIFSLGKDKDGGLWISHIYGYTRVDLSAPFRDFTVYPGLEGHLLGTLFNNNILYVATSEGIYYLSKERSFLQIKNSIISENIAKQYRPNFFESIFHKRKRREDREEENITVVSKTIPVWKTISDNKFIYKKISGFTGKCRQIIEFNGKILATSNSGVYEIKDFKAVSILKEHYVTCITPSRDRKSIYVGLRNGLILIENKDSKWNINKIFNEAYYVNSISEDYLNNIWIGSNGKVIRIKTDKENRRLIENKIYALKEFNNENVLVRNVKGVPTFFSGEKIFFYTGTYDTLWHDPAFTNRNYQRFKYTYCQETITWFKSDSTWIGLDHLNEEDNKAIPYLSLFKNIKSIYIDRFGYFWVIDGENKIYKFFPHQKDPDKHFEIHIKEIKNQQGNFLSFNNLDLTYENKVIHFSVSAPFYIDEESVEYQYYTKGIMEDWSEWSRNNKIEFNYLPVGNYTLHIRAKNAFGQYSEIKKLSFKILPPYWRTSWFFTLEIILFLSLISISIILNRSRESSFFTKVITFLTLIIIIEFVVYNLEPFITIDNNENPFLRFTFNVMLALMITPLEKFLGVIISRRKVAKIMIYFRNNFT